MENPLIRIRSTSDSQPVVPERIDSVVARSGIDHSYVYAAIFVVLGIGAAIWLSHSLQALLWAPTLKSLIFLGVSAGLLALFALFQSLLIVSRSWNIILIVIETLALLGYFYSEFSVWVLGAGVLFCALAVRAYLMERVRLQDDMRFQFFRYANRFGGLFFTGFTIFCAMIIVGMFQGNGGISEGAFELLLRGVTPALSYSLKTPIEGSTEIETVVRGYLTKTFEQRNEYKLLTPSQQEAALSQGTAEAIDSLGAQVGTPILEHETVGFYLYRLIQELIVRINALHLGPAIAIGFLLFAGLFIRSLLIFIKIPTLIVARIVYAVLAGTGIISISSEARLKEVLVIK